MSSHQSLNPDFFLNRLALEKMTDPHTVDLLEIISSFFEFSNAQEAVNLFRDTCQAGLTRNYSWKGGSAGNLVFFYERLEMLVEVCYLLNTKQPAPVHWDGDQQTYATSQKFSEEELINPFLTIGYFFELYDLPAWKQLMHFWMEAAISNYSVVENVDTISLLPYYEGMEKLIVAAGRISVKDK